MQLDHSLPVQQTHLDDRAAAAAAACSISLSRAAAAASAATRFFSSSTTLRSLPLTLSLAFLSAWKRRGGGQNGEEGGQGGGQRPSVEVC